MYGDWKSQAEKVEKDALDLEREEHEKMLRYQQLLQHQIYEQEQKKKEDYALFLKEKAMVDEIVKKIIIENER